MLNWSKVHAKNTHLRNAYLTSVQNAGLSDLSTQFCNEVICVMGICTNLPQFRAHRVSNVWETGRLYHSGTFVPLCTHAGYINTIELPLDIRMLTFCWADNQSLSNYDSPQTLVCGKERRIYLHVHISFQSTKIFSNADTFKILLEAI